MANVTYRQFFSRVCVGWVLGFRTFFKSLTGLSTSINKVYGGVDSQWEMPLSVCDTALTFRLSVFVFRELEISWCSLFTVR